MTILALFRRHREGGRALYQERRRRLRRGESKSAQQNVELAGVRANVLTFQATEASDRSPGRVGITR